MSLSIDILDYVILIGLLLTFIGIGIYFGVISKQLKTFEYYFLGNRNFNSFIIAASLIASQISVVTILTLPVEVYNFGLHTIWSSLALVFILPIISFIILPIFYENNIWNCFEYLEKRFNRDTRNLVTGLFIIKMFLMMPILTFIPSLIFSQVTNINIHLINGIVCCVCVFYTMLGGANAVIWAQMIQGFIMFITVLLIIILILVRNNIEDIFLKANNGGRLYITDFTFDLTTRSTFWSTLLGGSFNWISFLGVQPIFIQRMLSLKSIKDGRNSLITFTIGCTILTAGLYFIGLALYSRYYQCDPLKAGVTKDLVTFFVQDLTQHNKIISSFYIACLFCMGMSTMSSNLNTLAGVLCCQFYNMNDKIANETNSNYCISRKFSNNNDVKRTDLIIKTIIIVTGIYTTVGALLIEKFNWIIKIVITASGVTQCFLAGLFLFGMVYPKAIGDAAFRATYFTICISVLIQFGTLLQKSTGLIQDHTLSSSLENCNELNKTAILQNSTNVYGDEFNTEQGGPLFKISFYWYSFIASVLVWIFGVPLSKLMSYKRIHKKLNPMLISSFVAKWIPQDKLIDNKSNYDFELEIFDVQKN
ncbi:sodium-coupled monocarboxylate transporter 2-like isoform X2 [Condylostylus longicornis]|nr:sodium-coupled monocarboxylate transporter 2-like isoform X2 [Condylostylus longicornis]XP_055379218.1 sodium-coupled monocarboxylate transporter 2-like isoform X2 [Condylostylus longicornis]